MKKGYKRPPRSKEWKDKISQSLLGRALSEEHKRKISEVRKGIILSSETKRKMSHAQKGKVFSPETRKKISESLKGRTISAEIRKKIAEGLRGRLCSQETRKKISKAQKNKPRPYQSGELNGCWKGGITPENHLIRTSIEYRLWRESVFARDNWTCQECEQKGGDLEAHHIKPFGEFKELRFAIDNGITYCIKCHKKIDKYRN